MNLKEPDNRSKCMYSRITYVINILFDISPWYQRLDLVCVLDTICHLIKLSKYLLLCFSSSFPIKFANCYPVFKCISLRACPETLDCLHLISLIHLVFVRVLKNCLISFFLCLSKVFFTVTSQITDADWPCFTSIQQYKALYILQLFSHQGKDWGRGRGGGERRGGWNQRTKGR